MKRSERLEILRNPDAHGYVNTGRTKRVIRGNVEYNYSIFKNTATGKEIRIQTSSEAKRRGRGQVINKKNVDNIINNIARDARLDPDTKRTLSSKIKSVLNDKNAEGKKLYMNSVNTIVANYVETLSVSTVEELDRLSSKKRIQGAIYNTGEMPDDLAARLSAQSGKSISEEDLLNPDNWSGNRFSFGGIYWNFSFSYSGEVFTRVGV